MPTTFNDVVESAGLLRVYGTEITGLPVSKDVVNTTKKGKLQYANIRAFAVGKYCAELPIPAIMIVAGDGQDVATEDKCGRAGEKIWGLFNSDETILLSFKRGNALALLEEAHSRGIDGGLTAENLRIENGQVCGTAHFWYDIEVFGQHIKDDKRFDFCVALNVCQTIYDLGIGSIEACVEAAPPNGVKLCLKLCVGKWGLSKCWDWCTYIGFKNRVESQSGCGCAATTN